MFGDVEAETPGACARTGSGSSASRRAERASFTTSPRTLPALLYARKIQQRAKAVGFEYPDVDGALADLEDELRELKEDRAPERRDEELGDVLFAAVNVARKLDVDPELELRRAAQRFRGAWRMRSARARERRGLERAAARAAGPLLRPAKETIE